MLRESVSSSAKNPEDENMIGKNKRREWNRFLTDKEVGAFMEPGVSPNFMQYGASDELDDAEPG